VVTRAGYARPETRRRVALAIRLILWVALGTLLLGAPGTGVALWMGSAASDSLRSCGRWSSSWHHRLRRCSRHAGMLRHGSCLPEVEQCIGDLLIGNGDITATRVVRNRLAGC